MIHTIHISDPKYPHFLKETSGAPEFLYAQGNLDLLQKPGLAIVGMRNCSKRGESIAFNWAKILSLQGLTIISGLAFGIDSYAHRGALAGSGATIAVVPACLPEVVPKSHESLAKEILAKGGLLLSEWDMPKVCNKNDYLIRNRLVSGLSMAVLVIEAGIRSGTLNTVKHAIEQNREVMAVPGRISDSESEGCLKLLQTGAFLVKNPEEIMQNLNLEVQKNAPPDLAKHLLKLYEEICASPKNAHEFKAEEMKFLSELEIQGLIKRDEFGTYSIL